MSHYSFCGANFANLIDPTGVDIFLFDKRGYLIHTYESEEDEIQIADENGKAIPGIYLFFDKKVMSINKDIQKDGMSFFL